MFYIRIFQYGSIKQLKVQRIVVQLTARYMRIHLFCFTVVKQQQLKESDSEH